MTIINGYKSCSAEKTCKKYDMLVCSVCPHGIKVEENLEKEGKEDEC